MNITGIITEYNPFHNGHKFHIDESKKLTNCDGIICVMSGNFTQRGLPAILDKWNRTKMALENGVDLVIELPTIFATSSAEFFSFGAVSILNSTNVVNSLCFGSEIGDSEILKSIATILLNNIENFNLQVKNEMKKGISFPKAREIVIGNIMNDETLSNLINSPNNILGIEYCKSILKLKSSITPVSIKRVGSNYNDTVAFTKLASATAVRELIQNNNLDECKRLMPESSFAILEKLTDNKYTFPIEDHMFNFIKYKLITTPDLLSAIPDVSEGLDNKILKELINCNSYEDLLFRTKSKRYTLTRISRILCHIFLGFENYPIHQLRKTAPKYLRVLGLNRRGREILKEIKLRGDIEIITKLPREINDPMLKLDIASTNCYSLLNKHINYNADYLTSPIIK
ncbi:nucleotidyltransferase [Inconstantimicrobium mannanitabidum]|uniref:UPF0348 protein n=1 Tax=Inconstantimicrobium mannanitabidum TaxID=1604901 RepID=A0ACB5RBX2_9CLOT|nr:nucleotidyltransferase [Clostridium sp. TW13]GKX66272.1 UPF0348 protein [Clostridium sp. TW13]